MAFCAKCGASLPEGANFYSSCGTTVGAALPSAGPLSSNVAALLSYVLWFITGIVFLMLEPYKKDKFVRLQCVLFPHGALRGPRVVTNISR